MGIVDRAGLRRKRVMKAFIIDEVGKVIGWKLVNEEEYADG